MINDTVFSTRNTCSNKKLFLPFQIRDNEGVTEQSLLPNFGACKGNLGIFPPRALYWHAETHFTSTDVF